MEPPEGPIRTAGEPGGAPAVAGGRGLGGDGRLQSGIVKKDWSGKAAPEAKEHRPIGCPTQKEVTKITPEGKRYANQTTDLKTRLMTRCEY